MNRREFVSSLAALPLAARIVQPQQAPTGRDFPIVPISHLDVEITDSFWSPRIEAARTVSLPLLLNDAEKHSRYQDTRILEGAYYFLAHHPDPVLKERVDSKLDDAIAQVRQFKQKWPCEADGSTIAGGDFILAAVAHHQATGSRKMLDVAIEIADDMDSFFGPGKGHAISNHECVEMALVSLYLVTGNERHLRLAKFFVDERGNWKSSGRGSYGSYAQDHVPIKEQTRAIGHCVRATYLYTGVTGVAALAPDRVYAQAIQRIWEDAVAKRTYLTGGVGSYRHHENYGDDYDLPTLNCWNEICAACGSVWWNHRLFLMNGDAKYLDVMERTLYNGLLAGISLSGDTFLYQAPLKAYGDFARYPHFGPNCCPPNITRFLASLGDLIYASSDQDLYINLLIGGKAQAKLKETPVMIQQETKYPWDGETKIIVTPAASSRFAVSVRIPCWARDEAMPGGLYRYSDSKESNITIAVNGRPANYKMNGGFARIEREWSKGDVIELQIPMPVRQVQARSEAVDMQGMSALERGPLVYCAEAIDNQAAVFNLLVPQNSDFQYAYRSDVMGGVGTITGKVQAWNRGDDKVSVTRKDHAFTAVPYYAFGNRGPGQMAVWLARKESNVELPPVPTIASTSLATSSCGDGTVAENYPGNAPPTVAKRWYPLSQDGSGDIRAICDQIEPVNSEDGSSYYLRLRPQSGEQAWVEYKFARPEKVSSVEIYWKDDKQYCPAPRAWRLLYKDNESWKPVSAQGSFGVERDKFNKLAFEPVITSGLRMEIQLQARTYMAGGLGPPDANWVGKTDATWYEGGVIEWKVNPA
jgi:uncharacterized protein